MHCAITLIAHAREEELRSPEEEQPWYRLEDWPQEWYRGDAIVEGRAKDIYGHGVSWRLQRKHLERESSVRRIL
jgi:hypothetical protein